MLHNRHVQQTFTRWKWENRTKSAVSMQGTQNHPQTIRTTTRRPGRINARVRLLDLLSATE